MPNVWLAECDMPHEKGDTIEVVNKYGQEREHIVFNLISEMNGKFYYSIVRADGFNAQERAKRKAEALQGYAINAESRSDKLWEASNEGADFLALGEPIKVGHHSEKRHRALIERNHNRRHKAMEEKEKAAQLLSRAEYWAKRTDEVNLSMPESVEYYEHKLEVAMQLHQDYKTKKREQEHSFSMTYAKKEVNELAKKVQLAKMLWD